MANNTEEVKPAKKFPYPEGSPAWQRVANSRARDFAPPIITCRECGAPELKGYCCNYCGSAEP